VHFEVWSHWHLYNYQQGKSYQGANDFLLNYTLLL